jgi:hypothetical protein
MRRYGSTGTKEAHHVRWWEHLGPTDIDNLVNICPGHHRLVHLKRIRVTRAGDHFEFTTATGTPIRGPTYG